MMNDISGSGNEMMLSKSINPNEIMAKILDAFQQLPHSLQLSILFGGLALFTYIIHEGYCISITGTGIQITKHSTIV